MERAEEPGRKCDVAREGAMVIQMKDYRKPARKPAVQERFGDGVLRVLVLPSLPTTQELSPVLPEDYVAVEQEFIDRVYALATQI